MKYSTLWLTAAVVLLAALSGCGDAPKPEVFHQIATIRADAAAWQGRTVRLKGKVAGLFSLPLMDSAYYELADDTGVIYVSTTRGLPAKGEAVFLTGTVTNMVAVGDITGGLTIKEASRW